jgi:hypothetical protein
MGALAVAEGIRWADAASVGLMTGRQPLTSRAGGQGRIDDCARHCPRTGYQVRYQEYDGVRGRSRPFAFLTGLAVHYPSVSAGVRGCCLLSPLQGGNMGSISVRDAQQHQKVRRSRFV